MNHHERTIVALTTIGVYIARAGTVSARRTARSWKQPLHGTDRAGMMGPPTFATFSSRGMAWFRMRGGQVAERWAVVDRLGAMLAITERATAAVAK